MQEPHITLEDLWREAEALEFDAEIQEGLLTIHKRGATTPLYQSLQPVNQVVIRDAWSWLQLYRATLDQIDQARSRSPRKRSWLARLVPKWHKS